MPNNVRNCVRMEGINELPIFTWESGGECILDFDKIIKMPPELLADISANKHHAMIYRSTERFSVSLDDLEALSPETWKVLKRVIGSRKFIWISWESAVDEVKKMNGEERDELYDSGGEILRRVRKYGYVDWYDWRIANWGTKWNSYECRPVGDDMVYFCTAWNAPEPVIRELSRRHPGLEVRHRWADEERGYNAGCAVWIGGEEVDGGPFENESEKAFAAYDDLWPCGGRLT